VNGDLQLKIITHLKFCEYNIADSTLGIRFFVSVNSVRENSVSISSKFAQFSQKLTALRWHISF